MLPVNLPHFHSSSLDHMFLVNFSVSTTWLSRGNNLTLYTSSFVHVSMIRNNLSYIFLCAKIYFTRKDGQLIT